jgi:hypothetical protein
MKKNSYLAKSLFFLGLILISSISHAQNDSIMKPKSRFWQNVRFGGGVGFNLGNDFTTISISPTLYHDFNDKITLGVGLNGSYIKSKAEYTSWIYGGSALFLYNPVEYIQISTEVEQLKVNVNIDRRLGGGTDNFWNTALFLGAGYRMNNFTVGLRYNILFDKSDRLYADAWMPFVRVIF